MKSKLFYKLPLLLVLTGCVRSLSQSSASRQEVIMVGQDISLAQAIASRKGYTVRDFSGFEMTSPPSGSFNIDLRGEWQLYVFANSAGKVSRIELMENAYAPKAFRVDHSVRSFDVGPAKFEREELRTLTPKKN